MVGPTSSGESAPFFTTLVHITPCRRPPAIVALQLPMGRFTSFGALIILLLAVASCSDGSNGGEALPGASGTEEDRVGSESSGIWRVTRLQNPVETPELSLLVLGQTPESLNPWRDPSDLGLLLFPRALRRNPESLEWEPWMAESWEIAEDQRSVEVTVRDGASWSDGTPVTAADWVVPANRYFTDRALRTPFRERPELAGLGPRWELVGELRFRISVEHPVDRNTLLSLLYVPPLPAQTLETQAGELTPSQELNELWGLSVGARGGEELSLPPSAGPYELQSLDAGPEGAVTAILRRRSAYRDPSYTLAAAERIELWYRSPSPELEVGSDAAEGAFAGDPDLIYLALSTARLQPPVGYQRVSAGTDMTPALLLFSPEIAEGEQLRRLAAEAKESFLASLQSPGVVPRALPSLGDQEVLFREAPGEGALDAGDLAGGADPLPGGSDHGEDAGSLRFLVLDRQLHREYAERFVESAEEADILIEPVYVGEQEIASALLTAASWDLLLLEIGERFDPVVGDPLLGNALPLTGQWSLLASEAPARSVLVEPLSPTELSALRVAGTEDVELPVLLPRLWRKVTASSREADRQRARDLLETIWELEEPWLYLYDEERLHYARRNLRNLLFRHIPGAELGTVLPQVYLEPGGTR